MRIFTGNPDFGVLHLAMQAGLTNVVEQAHPCDNDANTDAANVLNERKAGIPVRAISIGNKPNTWHHVYNRDCDSAQGAADAIKALRQALDARGLTDVLVLGPETVEWEPYTQEEITEYDFAPGDNDLYFNALADDRAAMAALGAVNTHSYGTAVTTDQQNYAVQHGKPYWISMNVEPCCKGGCDPAVPGDAVANSTLLSDLNHGVTDWFFWTWNMFVCMDCKPQTITDIKYSRYYYNLTNILGAIDVGARVRRATSEPALPTADMHFNNGSEPAITAAAAKNPDGSWGIALVNLTGYHSQLMEPPPYDPASSKDMRVQVCVEELANAGNMTFHRKDFTSHVTGITTGHLELPDLSDDLWRREGRKASFSG